MKKNRTITNTAGFIIVTSLILYTVLLIALHPGFITHFKWQRDRARTEFISSIMQQNAIEPKEYWQFREFYSRGNFSYDTNVIGFEQTQRIRTLPSEQSLLMHFESPYLVSDDFIVKMQPKVTIDTQIKNILDRELLTIGSAPLIYSDERTRILETDQNIFIIFVKSVEEMKQANGLSDYTSQEQKLLEDTLWLNITKMRK